MNSCFVIIRFDTEFLYLFRFIEQILAARKIRCERADRGYPSEQIISQIKNKITDADFVIVDITGSNPNVFYELGLADAQHKPFILIRREPVRDSNELPFDIRSIRVIDYEKDVNFSSELNSAIDEILTRRYDALYQRCVALIQRLKQAKITLGFPSLEIFRTELRDLERVQSLPNPETAEDRDIIETIIFKLISSTVSLETMSRLNTWLDEMFPSDR